MKEKMKTTLEYLKQSGAEYADIRVVDTQNEVIQTEQLNVKSIDNTRSLGVGVRVIVNGSLGFASSHDVDDLQNVADRAIRIARASLLAQKDKIILAPKEIVEDHYQTPIVIDPFLVPLEEKIEMLLRCERAMANASELSKTSTVMNFQLQEKIYADTEGSFITQKLYESGAGIQAYATFEGDTQMRSFPSCFDGNHGTGGFELIEAMALEENAPHLAKEVYQLVRAENCPSGLFDLIIDSDQMQLQIHESVGHPVELDRMFGSELAFAGGSFVKPEMIESGFKYGSEHVTIVADGTIEKSLGTYGYDDDGVKSNRVVIIDKGILKNVISSRDTAIKIGRPSSATNRADGWNNLPIVRMNTISLMPGEYELGDLIAGVEDGFYLKTNKSWSIDDMRVNFQFATEIAYEIKSGKMTGKIYKNPVYAGITPEFWASCDGVANEKYFRLLGVPHCGKGQPMQVAHVAHGSSPARFRQVKVGV